jgi:hypothetical protein
MKIKFQGEHTSQEVVESLSAILQMLAEQYHIKDFSDIKLNMTLIRSGEAVELMDPDTGEIFDILEVHKDMDSVEENFMAGEEAITLNSSDDGNITRH